MDSTLAVLRRSSADAEEDLGGELVEALVGVALGAEGDEVEGVALEGGCGLLAVLEARADALDGRVGELPEVLQDLLNFRVSVKACDLVLEDVVRAHAVIA